MAAKQQVPLTLREVVRVFNLRMGRKPLTYRYKEEQHDHQRHPAVLGAELVFDKVTPAMVKHAMQGLDVVEPIHKVKGNLTTHAASWKYESPTFKFRVTLRVHAHSQASFIFTTIW